MPRFFNTSNRPIVYNDKGQIFGAGEWLETAETEQLKVAMAYGEVINLPEVEEEPKPKSRTTRARSKTQE